MFCQQCGSVVPGEGGFCPTCGSVVERPAARQPQIPLAIPPFLDAAAVAPPPAVSAADAASPTALAGTSDPFAEAVAQAKAPIRKLWAKVLENLRYIAQRRLILEKPTVIHELDAGRFPGWATPMKFAVQTNVVVLILVSAIRWAAPTMLGFPVAALDSSWLASLLQPILLGFGYVAYAAYFKRGILRKYGQAGYTRFSDRCYLYISSARAFWPLLISDTGVLVAKNLRLLTEQWGTGAAWGLFYCVQVISGVLLCHAWWRTSKDLAVVLRLPEPQKRTKEIAFLIVVDTVKAVAIVLAFVFLLNLVGID